MYVVYLPRNLHLMSSEIHLAGRITRWAAAHRFAVDALWVMLAGLPAALLSNYVSLVGRGPAPSRFAVITWSLALIAPLAWRRVQPVYSTAVVAAIAVSQLLLGGIALILPAGLAILISLWSVTVYGPKWAHRSALGVAFVGAILYGGSVASSHWRRLELAEVAVITLLAGTMALAVWAIALLRRTNVAMVAALRDRADRLEIERDQQAAIATAAERTRIAREMHDIVAHSLSVVVAQADGGRYAAAADPAAAERALTFISETGRAALADMRRLLGVLRADSDAQPRSPQPGMSPGTPQVTAVTADGDVTVPVMAGALSRGDAADPEPRALAAEVDDAELGTLVDQSRTAGMNVSLVRVGEPRRLPPGAGLTMHRIAQESLTNVRKHGGPGCQVTVVVRWGAGAVELEVADDGRGAAATGVDAVAPSGYGLTGMRERAALFGGTLTAGPKPGGGWRVRFTMPLPR